MKKGKKGTKKSLFNSSPDFYSGRFDIANFYEYMRAFSMSDRKNSHGNLFKKSIFEEKRPWGKFRSFPYTLAKSIKIITVNPGQALSLQYHRKRSEFWVILDEDLEITAGEHVWKPQKNEEIFIPEGMPHRVRCLGQKPARIMEIWLGKPDESDIVRLKDDYGRKSEEEG